MASKCMYMSGKKFMGFCINLCIKSILVESISKYCISLEVFRGDEDFALTASAYTQGIYFVIKSRLGILQTDDPSHQGFVTCRMTSSSIMVPSKEGGELCLATLAGAGSGAAEAGLALLGRLLRSRDPLLPSGLQIGLIRERGGCNRGSARRGRVEG